MRKTIPDILPSFQYHTTNEQTSFWLCLRFEAGFSKLLSSKYLFVLSIFCSYGLKYGHLALICFKMKEYFMINLIGNSNILTILI